MKKLDDKQRLFEVMQKVGGMPLKESSSIVKQIIKEENELNIGDNANNFLKFIKQTRFKHIQKWQEEIKKYEEHLKNETNEYAIKLKKDEIERLRNLISIYSK